MAFTNIYDDTFPADTELANLIGANLRQVRLDVQQRMAAISGLDASKPAFGSDTQPNNWNGILFFATDTGKVYQFNNPSWTDITTSVLQGTRVLGSNVLTQVAANSTIFVSPIGAVVVGSEIPQSQLPMLFGGTFRGLSVNLYSAQPAGGSLTLTLRINGVSQGISVVIPASSGIGNYSDTAHSANFTAGQLVDIQVVNTVPAAQSGGFCNLYLTY